MTRAIVVIKPGYDRDTWIAAMKAAGLKWSGFDNLPRIFSIEDSSAASFLLRDHPAIESLEDERIVRPMVDQSISLDADLSGGAWAIARVIRRAAPWPTDRLQFPRDTYFRCVRDGTGVDWYSIDSGVLTTHAEFGARATTVYDPFATVLYFHGTYTTSLGCGSTVGLARGADIWAFRCLNASGAGTDTNIINALDQALGHYNGRAATGRPAVANMSLVGAGSAINTAVAALIDAGMVVVACAGNDSLDLGTINEYPAESDVDAIVVGGSGAADIPYYATVGGTNWGDRVDIVAPGQNIYGATSTGDADYTQERGTSCSSAFVAGAVACMLEGHSRLAGRTEVQSVKAALLANATTGKLTLPGSFPMTTLPDKLLYLDPDQAAPEAITGL